MDDFGGFDDGYYDTGYVDTGYVDNGYVDEVVGMDMVADGMMQYQEGVILTEMGMPGLGMAEMQMGQMEMMQGDTLMEVGMIENGMGYGMGYGYGMGPMGGIVAAEEALLVAQTAALVCLGVGCTRPCCVRTCAPGCVLPCCQKKIMIVNNKPVVYTQPVMNRPINQQVIVNQGYNQQRPPMQQMQQMQQIKPIFTGPIYRQHNFSWNYNQNAMLTMTHFLDQSLSGITKLKIKREILHNDCFFLKTTTFNATDHYFAVPRHQQVNWFCSIIWAKLQLQRFNCNLFQEFNGFIEGKIMRKSKFLGEWAFRDVVIDMEGLKSYKSKSEMPTTRIPRIPELWTRFELVEQQTCLVIKLHFEGTKYEYAVPLNSAIYWIRAFASLMR